MAYNPILETAQLPAPGPLPEDLRFDMKLMLKPEGEDTLANDVAAFANTTGGVLLIGANEHPRDSGVLHAYRGMSYAEANAVGAKLAKALQLCSPIPVAEARPILLAGGDSYVVAINCDSYAAPPIGVRQSGQTGGTKWWSFPTRRGRDTHNLRPEELATIMEPRLRRMVLLLGRIRKFPPDDRPRAVFHWHASGLAMTMDILAIDPDAMSMRLLRLQYPAEVLVPLDAVQLIWQDANNGLHHVALHGQLEAANDGIRYMP